MNSTDTRRTDALLDIQKLEQEIARLDDLLKHERCGAEVRGLHAERAAVAVALENLRKELEESE